MAYGATKAKFRPSNSRTHGLREIENTWIEKKMDLERGNTWIEKEHNQYMINLFW